MNKLKKKSRTLAYAEAKGAIYNEKLDATSAQNAPNLNQVALGRSTGHATLFAEEATHALTTFYANGLEERVSQAWITRALKAEAMLSIREVCEYWPTVFGSLTTADLSAPHLT